MDMVTDRQAGGLGGVLPRFSAGLLDETSCRRVVIDCLHGATPRCPGCGQALEAAAAGRESGDDLVDLARWEAGQRVRCRGCGRTMSYTTGTVLEGLHISAAELVLFLALRSFAVAHSQIAAIMQRDPGTISNWCRRLIHGKADR